MELLSIADIAKALNLPVSNVRYYRDKFSEFIPYVGEGRNRKYRPEAVEILRFIADGFKDNLPSEQIEAGLRSLYPMTINEQQQTITTQQQTATMLQELLRESLRSVVEEAVQEALKPALEKLNAKQNEAITLIEQMKQQTATTQEGINEIVPWVHHMKKEVDDIKKQPLPWWKRLFNR